MTAGNAPAPWSILSPLDRRAAEGYAGHTAGQGMAIALYGTLFAAAAASVIASGGTGQGSEYVALPLGLVMLGFGSAGYIEGDGAHRALVDEVRPQPVSGLRYVRPDDAPRAAVLPVFGAGR